jgi:hypothetical protein
MGRAYLGEGGLGYGRASESLDVMYKGAQQCNVHVTWGLSTKSSTYLEDSALRIRVTSSLSMSSIRDSRITKRVLSIQKSSSRAEDHEMRQAVSKSASRPT